MLEQARQQRERAKVEEANALAAQEKIKAEQERLRAEQAAREEQERLREIAAKKVPPLPPLPTPKPQQQPTAPQPQPPAPPAPVARANPEPPAQPRPQPFSQPKPPTTAAVNGTATPRPPASNAAAAPTATVPSVHTPHDAKRQRAVEIHKNLKQLRAVIASQSLQNKPLKSRAGDLRREIRKVIGQLSLDKDGNKVVVSKCLLCLVWRLPNVEYRCKRLPGSSRKRWQTRLAARWLIPAL